MNTYEQQEKRERDAQAILANAIDEVEASGIAKGIVIGKAEGKAEGIAEGEAKSLLKVVKNMVLQKMNDALILQATSVSKETLARLKEELNNDETCE